MAQVRERIVEIVKGVLIPGSTPFLMFGFFVAIVLLHAGGAARGWADAGLAALAMLYWLLSLPAVAHALIRRLKGRYGTIASVAQARGATVLVVVGNGSVSYTDGQFTIDQLTRRSTFCVFETVRLYRLLRTDHVIVSGGAPHPGTAARAESELMREELVTLGVPVERIRVDASSRTTEEQAANVALLLRQRDPQGCAVVVTTAAHMPRVMQLFVAQGIDAIPSVTPDLRYDEGRMGWGRWWPSMTALRGSESAMYEYLALVHLKMTLPKN